jgi:hypothetical protein
MATFSRKGEGIGTQPAEKDSVNLYDVTRLKYP